MLPRSQTSMCVAGLSKASRKPASNWSVARFQLSGHVEIFRTCLLQVGNQVCKQVCDLDSVMEFGLKQIADRFELSRQAGFEMVCDLVCHWMT